MSNLPSVLYSTDMSKSHAATPTTDPGRATAQRAPGSTATGRAERRDALLRFLTNPPREVAEVARALREAEAQYGDDADQELADLEAGQHPLQQAKADSPMR